MDTTEHTRTLKMNTVQDTITCWLSIVTGSCGQVHSSKTHSYINSPINARSHTERVPTWSSFSWLFSLVYVLNELNNEWCLLTLPDKSKNSNSHHTAFVKICSIKGKPKLQAQETEKHIHTRTLTAHWRWTLSKTQSLVDYQLLPVDAVRFIQERHIDI